MNPIAEEAPPATTPASGDGDAALLATFRRVGPAMWRQALALLGDRAAAEDVVQEAFLRVWRRRERLRPGELDGYLVQAARNLALDQQRWRARRGAGDTADPATVALVVPRHDDALAESERLSRALQQLPPEQREVVLLRVVDGLTFPELAARTGAAEGTVCSRLRYGLARLRQLMSRPASEEGR